MILKFVPLCDHLLRPGHRVPVYNIFTATLRGLVALYGRSFKVL